METVQRLHEDEGLSIVIVEQQASFALGYTDRAYFLEKGEVRYEGPSAGLPDRGDLLRSVFLAGAVEPASPARRRRAPAWSELLGYLVLGVSVGLIYGLLAARHRAHLQGHPDPQLRPPVPGLLCAFVHVVAHGEGVVPPVRRADAGRASSSPRVLGARARSGSTATELEHSLFRKLRDAPRLDTARGHASPSPRARSASSSLLFDRNAGPGRGGPVHPVGDATRPSTSATSSSSAADVQMLLLVPWSRVGHRRCSSPGRSSASPCGPRPRTGTSARLLGISRRPGRRRSRG